MGGFFVLSLGGNAGQVRAAFCRALHSLSERRALSLPVGWGTILFVIQDATLRSISGSGWASCRTEAHGCGKDGANQRGDATREPVNASGKCALVHGLRYFPPGTPCRHPPLSSMH